MENGPRDHCHGLCFISFKMLQGVENPVRPQLDVTPSFNTAPQIQVHVASAILSFLTGLYLLSGWLKGTTTHWRLGWIWVIALASTAISSSFLIGLNGHSVNLIHGLSAWTIIILPFAVFVAEDIRLTSTSSICVACFWAACLWLECSPFFQNEQCGTSSLRFRIRSSWTCHQICL